MNEQETSQLVIKHNNVWCAVDVCDDLTIDQLEGLIAGLNSQLDTMRKINDALKSKTVEDDIPF